METHEEVAPVAGVLSFNVDTSNVRGDVVDAFGGFDDADGSLGSGCGRKAVQRSGDVLKRPFSKSPVHILAALTNTMEDIKG